MHLELSELLACPSCGPRHGVVVSVDRIERRRVLEGFLSCPTCESRFPIRGGVIEFGTESGPEGEPAADASATRTAVAGRAAGGAGGGDGPGSDDALRLAALLDLREGGGFVLLGRGLYGAAAGTAELAPGVELLALVGVREAVVRAPRVSSAAGVSETSLPLRDLQLRGAALRGGGAAALVEATRTVRPGGRVIVLRPTSETLEATADLPLEVVVAEEAAIVALRR
ncbi:MAG: Trm112 family protein [Candidatus Palauibacterales bacterium]|nr:Trm112 family protein [Candidatus Palauibacterales bacterium]